MFSSQYVFKRDAEAAQHSYAFSLASLTALCSQPGSFIAREFTSPRTVSLGASSSNSYVFQGSAPPLTVPPSASLGFSTVAPDPPHTPSITRPVLASPRPAIPCTPATASANPYVFQAGGQLLPRPSSDSLGALTAVFEPLHVSSIAQNPNNSYFASDIATAASAIAFSKPGKARQPKSGDVHRPSALRPIVPACMRSLVWQTPHGIAAVKRP